MELAGYDKFVLYVRLVKTLSKLSLIALVLLFGQGFEVFHNVVTPHGLNAQGDVVHTTAHEFHAPSSVPGVTQDIEEGEDYHCESFCLQRRFEPSQLAVLIASAAPRFVAPAPSPVAHVVDSQLTYFYAPKNGPPV